MKLEFRIWDKKSSAFIKDNNILISACGNYVSWLHKPWEGNLENRSVPDGAIIQQFTGLTDKKGKKIFEGDICDIFTENQEDKSWEIYWDQEQSRFIFRKQSGDALAINNLTIFAVDRVKMTVVGNIFENPELLKNDSVTN